ncbi:uncharacterized protein BKCO1_2000019 [Diplodia corticola]|uniref:Uncharacterized protein n=1 Tax=Diplodia corticola TaxID=236234 RepID=A0A1J9S5G3_9PEZI|nr:uncharacterized protein BKCO1_2000019 [Diplodia corticola]OJD34853.1 hypothetical protein BKCO1_2000019 [Diplodia corticola]
MTAQNTTAGPSSSALGYSPSSAPAARVTAATHFETRGSVSHSEMGQQASSPPAAHPSQRPRTEQRDDGTSLFLPREPKESTLSDNLNKRSGNTAYRHKPPPESGNGESSSRMARVTGQRQKARYSSQFMPKVAKTGYWEDRHGYPDVGENAEGEGIRCETETESDSDKAIQNSPATHRPSKSRGRKGGPRGKSDRTRSSDTVDSDVDDAPEFKKAKAIYDSKVASGKATTEDLIWFSGLAAEEKVGARKLEEAKRQEIKDKQPVTPKKSHGMFREETSSTTDGNEEAEVPYAHSATSTPNQGLSSKKYGMFSQPAPWMTPNQPSSSSITTNSAAASDIGTSSRGARDASPRTPSRRRASPDLLSVPLPTPSSSTMKLQADDDLSFGIIYRIDKDTNEIMIPRGHVANMVLHHYRSGALTVAKSSAQASDSRSQPPPEDEISLGTTYSLHPDTGEVMIPPSYAKNLILLHQRSGALNLSPGSLPSPDKRRRMTTSNTWQSPRGRGTSSVAAATSSRRPRGRPRGGRYMGGPPVVAKASSAAVVIPKTPTSTAQRKQARRKWKPNSYFTTDEEEEETDRKGEKRKERRSRNLDDDWKEMTRRKGIRSRAPPEYEFQLGPRGMPEVLSRTRNEFVEVRENGKVLEELMT